MQLVYRPLWVERYLPAVAERQAVAYSDIDGMTQEQAQAVCYLLVEKLLFYEGAARKAQARNIAFAEPEDSDEPENSGPRLALWLCRTALNELCAAYNLDSPA